MLWSGFIVVSVGLFFGRYEFIFLGIIESVKYVCRRGLVRYRRSDISGGFCFIFLSIEDVSWIERRGCFIRVDVMIYIGEISRLVEGMWISRDRLLFVRLRFFMFVFIGV